MSQLDLAQLQHTLWKPLQDKISEKPKSVQRYWAGQP